MTYDPTPADLDVGSGTTTYREDARLAWSLGFIYRHLPTTRTRPSVSWTTAVTTFAFPARARLRAICGRCRPGSCHKMSGRAPASSRTRHRRDGRAERRRPATRSGGSAGDGAWPGHRRSFQLEGFAKFNDWGPYDYHRDFNLTFPVHAHGRRLVHAGLPRWFGVPQTKIGGSARSVALAGRELEPLTAPRSMPDPGGNLECDPTAAGRSNGMEWEIRTYLHLSL